MPSLRAWHANAKMHPSDWARQPQPRPQPVANQDELRQSTVQEWKWHQVQNVNLKNKGCSARARLG